MENGKVKFYNKEKILDLLQEMMEKTIFFMQLG